VRVTSRWLSRLTRAVGATTAGSVLVLGAPVGTQTGTGTAVPTAAGTPDTALALVAADPHRWPGHPNRRLIRYHVRRGDTATGLAVRWHAWTAELRSINHLGRHGALRAGQRIRIPVVMTAWRRAHPHRARHHRHHTTKHHTTKKPWKGTDKSRAQVRRLVARTARRHGVNPYIALAISWQESGWQQYRVSSAGAVGAMQVMPGTGRWMSLYVGRRLNIYSLRDNVLAGVVLIKVLRRQTTTKRTIAAYYQGLGSVRRRGMYPSTRAYTRSVTAIHRRIHAGWRPA
jgi:transglycosylase-like protein with SLT domain/LysM domain-containing protein